MDTGNASDIPIGGLQPPPGVTPNFVDPYSIMSAALAVTIVFLVLTSATTAIRLYTKFYLIKTHGWEDYTILIAWAGSVAYSGIIASGKHGAGVHQWDVLLTELIPFARLEYVAGSMYLLLIALIKLSICLQYLHIFVVNRGKEFWMVHIFIWINMSFFVGLFFASIFQCSPRAKYWNWMLPGHCLNLNTLTLVAGIFNFVSDFLMLLFPLYCTWNLRMSTKRKLGVSAIFFVGTLALVSDILRIIFSGINLVSNDQTFNAERVGLCIAGEATAGILAGNLVVFPRFFNTYYPKVTQSFSNRSHKPSERSAKSSASWRNENKTGSVTRDYMELNDQNYKSATFDGRGPRPFVSATAFGHNAERDTLGASEETEETNGIWKTVRMHQGVDYV